MESREGWGSRGKIADTAACIRWPLCRGWQDTVDSFLVPSCVISSSPLFHLFLAGSLLVRWLESSCCPRVIKSAVRFRGAPPTFETGSEPLARVTLNRYFSNKKSNSFGDFLLERSSPSIFVLMSRNILISREC